MKPGQVMYKSRNITDFFKPFAQPISAKRLREDDNIENSLSASARTRSKSPKTEGSATAGRQSANTSSNLSSSSLSSLNSDPLSQDNYHLDLTAQTGRSKGCKSTGQNDNGPFEGILTSSQRVLKNGEIMIRNSDDESDSEVSLGDLDQLLAPRNPILKSSPPHESDFLSNNVGNKAPHAQERIVTERTRSRGLRRRSRPPESLPVMTKYKFSLDSLVAQAERDDAAEAGALHAKLMAEELDVQRAIRNSKASQTCESKSNIDEGLLASMVENEGDGEVFERLVLAIQRTEALHQEKSWLFFDPTDHGQPYEPREIPHLEDKFKWHKILNVPLDREQAFLNGYVGEIAAKGKLPAEILLWIVDAICTEPTEMLRDAYVSTIMDSADRVTSLLTAERIDLLFRKLGAHNEALDLGRPVVAVIQPLSKENGLSRSYSRLLSVLELLVGTAERLNSDARIHALCLICRLSLDVSITRDSIVMTAIEHSFMSLVDAIPADNFEHETLVVLSTIYPQISDAELRLQLLRSIPASTTRLNLLRRRLSLAFFFEDSTFLMAQSLDIDLLSAIAQLLREPQFLVNYNTDYSELAASIAVLDIGLDDGNVPCSMVLPEHESEFNKDIDKLAKILKAMFTRIIDTGASHMLRTQAKDVLEALHSRLTFAARTKPRPKKGLFGDSRQEPIKGGESRNYWKKFLAMRRENVHLTAQQT